MNKSDETAPTDTPIDRVYATIRDAILANHSQEETTVVVHALVGLLMAIAQNHGMTVLMQIDEIWHHQVRCNAVAMTAQVPQLHVTPPRKDGIN